MLDNDASGQSNLDHRKIGTLCYRITPGDKTGSRQRDKYVKAYATLVGYAYEKAYTTLVGYARKSLDRPCRRGMGLSEAYTTLVGYARKSLDRPCRRGMGLNEAYTTLVGYAGESLHHK